MTCGRCPLYDYPTATCKVTILHEGRHRHLPMHPKDECFFMQEGEDGPLYDDIQELRVFQDGETVKIELPDDGEDDRD